MYNASSEYVLFQYNNLKVYTSYYVLDGIRIKNLHNTYIYHYSYN